jgi:hypothetical protein
LNIFGHFSESGSAFSASGFSTGYCQINVSAPDIE